MYEFALVVHTLAANVFVAVILGPRLLGFLQLPADPVTANVRQDGAKPLVEHRRLQLESDPESNRLGVHARDQGERVISSHEPAFEKIHLALGPENSVVKLHRAGEHLFISDVYVSLGHGTNPPKTSAGALYSNLL